MNSNMTPNDVKDDEYLKRRKEFTDKLLAYHRMKGNPIRRFPLLGGRELDLYHLYTKVKQLGGSYVVTKERNWGEVSRSFNLPSTVTSASYACRQNYLKFLQEYEHMELQGSTFDPTKFTPKTVPPVRQSRIHPVYSTPSPTPPPPVNARLSRNSFSTLSSHLPNLLALPGLQGLGNLLDQLSKAPNQLQVLSSMLHLPPNQVQLLELLMQQHQQQQQTRVLDNSRNDWLVRSLQSGFPNEVDFCLNSLLIMSSDNKGVLPLNDIPQLVDVLLAHVGIFCKDDPYLEILYKEEWYNDNNQDYQRMWLETTPEHVYYNVIDEIYHHDTGFSHLFPSESVMSEDNIESVRVSEIAMIMRNFSFDEINAKFLALHEGTLKLLLLGMNCSLPTIQSLCLDTLANIAPHLRLDSISEEEGFDNNSISYLLLSSLQELVLSNNRLCVIRAIECVGSLAYSLTNNTFLDMICSDVYLRIIQCLLLPDIQLISTCLESLYCLTFYGKMIGQRIIDCNNCISILVGMVTFEFNSSANVIDGLTLLHIDGTKEIVTMATNDKQQDRQKSSTPQKDASISPPVTMTTSATTTTPLRQEKPAKNPIQLSSKFPTTKMDDNKMTFGKQWLNKLYELNGEEFLSKREIYSKYLNSCSNQKLLTAATQTEFDVIIKETFPAVTFTTVKLSGQDVQLVGGISKKSVVTHNQPVTTPVTAPVTTLITSPVTTTPVTSPVTTIPVTTIPKNQSIPMSNHIHNRHHITKPDSVSSRGSSSTPSRSPSPSLSPLQQLIQQAKIKKLTMPSPLSNAKASPLLVSNKMNQVIKTGITSESLRTSDHIQVDKLSNGLCVSINGIASEEERLTRKRSFDDNDDYNIVRKIARTEYQKKVTPVDTPTCYTTTPTCSATTPTCLTTTPTYYTATPTCSTATPIIDPLFRSTSLPPSSNITKERKIDKARSLTPPIIAPHKHMFDTNKLVSTTSTTSLPGSTSSLITGDSRTVCLWKNCLEIMKSPDDMFYHVMYDHLSSLTSSTYSLCEWTGCPSKAKRMLPSLSRHVQTHHCSATNKHVSPNVALTLMKLRTVPNWECEDESTVTKSIRLTAALVLRNLLETVPNAKFNVSIYESRLIQVALSTSEASTIIAQCLYLLSSSPTIQ